MLKLRISGYLFPFLLPAVFFTSFLNPANAQVNDQLREQVKEVINLIIEGENRRDPEPLIKAIHILLKEDRIRSMDSDVEGPSLDYQTLDYFNLDVLYQKAWNTAAAPSKKMRKKFARLKSKIDKKKIRTMDLQSDGRLEIKICTVKASGVIPLFFSFNQGNEVEFSIEVGNNFSVDILKSNTKIKASQEEIGDQNVYSFAVNNDGRYEMRVSNKLIKEVECIIYKYVK